MMAFLPSHTDLQKMSQESFGFWIPPPIAIAHHLIRMWAMRDGPWFSNEDVAKDRDAVTPKL